MAEENKYTHIGIEKVAQRKIAILAPITGKKIYELVAGWVDAAWEVEKAAGRVSDAMLVGPKQQTTLPVVVEQPSASQLVLPA